MPLFVVFVFLVTVGCAPYRRMVVPKGSVSLQGDAATNTDNNDLTSDLKSEPLASETMFGGNIGFFVRKNVSMELGALQGTHDFKNDDGDVIGTVEATPIFLNVTEYRSVKGMDGLSAFIGVGSMYAQFKTEEEKTVDNLEIEDSLGYTTQVGLMYYLTKERNIHLLVRLRGNYLRTSVDVDSGGSSSSEKEELLELIPSAGIGITF